MGLTFPNRVGLAAGLNSEHIDVLTTMGFGFIEIGTITRVRRATPNRGSFAFPKSKRSSTAWDLII